LMNDWSARDVQAWEYVPLGPFDAKNFGTSVSGWIITNESLEYYRTKRMDLRDTRIREETELLPYLVEDKRHGREIFDINLQVLIKPAGSTDLVPLFTTSSENLLYSFPQMIAHHTITGCALRPGDLLGSGTISGVEKTSVGSLLEATQNGKEVMAIETKDLGTVKRTWLEDGDEIVIRGYAGEGERRVGFGDCVGKILEAKWPEKLKKVMGQKKEQTA